MQYITVFMELIISDGLTYYSYKNMSWKGLHFIYLFAQDGNGEASARSELKTSDTT
jgi:hypothetical protein